MGRWGCWFSALVFATFSLPEQAFGECTFLAQWPCDKMDRAERRQRRLEKKIMPVGQQPKQGKKRVDMAHGSEASNSKSKDQPESLKGCHRGPGEDSSSMFRPGSEGPKSSRNACGTQWANQGSLGGRMNFSDKEGTDGVTIYEEETKLSPKDLQAKLHLSDARSLKWQKIAADRLQENKELQTEIECLNLKVKEITEARAVRHGHFESRLRAEIQSLTERNDELIKVLDNWVTVHFSIHSSEMEKLMQILQNAKCNKQSSHYQASQEAGNAERRVHENGNQAKGNRESGKQVGNFDRNGCDIAAEVNVDPNERDNGYPGKTQHLGGHGCNIAQQVHVDGGHNKSGPKLGNFVYSGKPPDDGKADMAIDIGGQSIEDANGLPGESQKAASIGKERPVWVRSEDASDALLTTAAERKSAMALVSQEFLMWLNSRIRRPTHDEMFSHKSLVMRRSGPQDEFWTGIQGSVLLDRFYTDTGMEKPSVTALSSLLRSVLQIEGSKRADDMLWCLVWVDCSSPAQLPGYTQHPHDTKRARVADDEVDLRSSKVRLKGLQQV